MKPDSTRQGVGKSNKRQICLLCWWGYREEGNLWFSFKFAMFIQAVKFQWPTYKLPWPPNSLSFCSGPLQTLCRSLGGHMGHVESYSPSPGTIHFQKKPNWCVKIIKIVLQNHTRSCIYKVVSKLCKWQTVPIWILWHKNMRCNLCNDDTLHTSACKYKPTLTMGQCKEREHPKCGLALASSRTTEKWNSFPTWC